MSSDLAAKTGIDPSGGRLILARREFLAAMAMTVSVGGLPAMGANCSTSTLGALSTVGRARDQLIPAGNRNGLLVGLGRYRMINSRIKRRVGRVGVNNLRLRYANWYISAAAVEMAAAGDVTLTASIEYPAGTFHQVMRNGEPKFVVPASASHVDTDPVPITVEGGADFWIHTHADWGAADNIFGIVCNSSIDGYEQGEALPDRTLTGGERASGFQRTYGPILVLGEALAPTAIVLAVGDSILYGNNETNPTGGDTHGNHGYVERLINPAGYPVIDWGVPGIKASQMNTAGKVARRTAALAGINITHYINELGRNDLNSGQTAAAIAPMLSGVNAAFADFGAKRIQATILPRTRSSNGFVDTAGQAFVNAALEGNRVALNALIRSKTLAPNVLDAADAFETARDSGWWKSDGGAWTNDGTHPTSLGAARGAALVDISRIDVRE